MNLSAIIFIVSIFIYHLKPTQIRINQFKNIIFSQSSSYQFHMFYFVYPNYLMPNSNNWFLPTAEPIQTVQSTEEEQNSTFCKQTISETILVKQCPDDIKQSYLTPDSPKLDKIAPKQKGVSKDEDYRPELYISKKSKKSQQLQNRNVVPNIIRLILSFIQKKGKSSTIVDKIFAKSSIGQGWTAKRFYLFQSMIRGKMNNYVNEDTLRQLVLPHPEDHHLYSEQEQAFYNTITRTLIQYFLREEISVCIVTSKRMDRTKKTHHLAALRNIREALPLLLRA